MPPKVNLLGNIYKRLLVIKETNIRSSNGDIIWECLCECGNTKKIQSSSLRRGLTQSCGCYNKEQVRLAATIHGQSTRTKINPTYTTWDAMIQRCTNPKVEHFMDYGGRGISVCERWLTFKNFYEDMGDKPSNKHSINRINNDGDYEQNNCRWDTMHEQSRGKRSNVWIEYNGERMVLTDWANKLGTSSSTIRRSINRGKSFEQIYDYYNNKAA